MINLTQTVDKLCISSSKTTWINCESFSSKLNYDNYYVQKTFIPPFFPIFFTQFSTKKLPLRKANFSTIPHSLNTTIINIFKKEV